MRFKLLALGTVMAMAAVLVPAVGAVAKSGVGTCADGVMAGGTYGNFVVSGICTIAPASTVHIDGNLTLRPGASLDDHGVEGFVGSELHIKGNIMVGRGAVLGLGWNAPEGTVGPDTVGGNIVANQPLALQIGNVTIDGNLISNGGGVLSTSAADFRNFPIKDNVIHGNLVVQGWIGGWIGVIRNTIDGNAIIANNRSRSGPTGPGAFFDSTEVMGSDASKVGGPVIPQTIGGNLICHGNIPAAQVNPDDLGAPNFVHGKALGQCAGLTQ